MAFLWRTLFVVHPNWILLFSFNVRGNSPLARVSKASPPGASFSGLVGSFRVLSDQILERRTMVFLWRIPLEISPLTNNTMRTYCREILRKVASGQDAKLIRKLQLHALTTRDGDRYGCCVVIMLDLID
jgi:hypothetical protein